MTGAGRSLDTILRAFIHGLLVSSAGLLAWAYAVEHDLGSSFLLGGSMICAASASLLLAFRLSVRALDGRALETRAGATAVGGATGGSLLALGARARWTLRLHRHSLHRVDGCLEIHNRRAEPLEITGLEARHPAGCRLALAEQAGDDPGATIDFGGACAALALRLPARARASLGFHVLLEDRALRAPHLALRVVLGRGRAPTVVAPMPQ